LYCKVYPQKGKAEMRVLRANVLGLCFGVRDALTSARGLDEPGNVTVYGELVHNSAVNQELTARGSKVVPEAERHELPATEQVLITAHGISDRRRAWLESAGKRLIDVTCPLVRRVHAAAQKLAAEGYFVVVIGRPGHVEVQGIVEDLVQFAVVQAPGDVARFPSDHIGVVCQSTTPPRAAQQIRRAIVRRNPHAEVRFVDTVCQPTRDRQQAVVELLARVPAIVIVGGRNSNNTRELVALARERGVPAFHVEQADELRPEWFASLEVVGLTAGTSTLDATIDEVEGELKRF
jgi:4-hydroxy-3-methylbut-2-en-1-yl diphosphate reductase